MIKSRAVLIAVMTTFTSPSLACSVIFHNEDLLKGRISAYFESLGKGSHCYNVGTMVCEADDKDLFLVFQRSEISGFAFLSGSTNSDRNNENLKEIINISLENIKFRDRDQPSQALVSDIIDGKTNSIKQVGDGCMFFIERGQTGSEFMFVGNRR